MQFQKSLVEKYLNNECTKDEAEIVLVWLQTAEGEAYLKKRMEEDLQNVAENHGFLLEVPDSKASLERILKASPSPGAAPRAGKGNLKRIWWAAAACVTLILAVVVVVWPSEAFVRHQTAFGEKKAITLPDGSKITLNGNSSIRHTESFGQGKKREVWMEGEGYFSVIHTRENTPFIVHIEDDLNVMVLGTEFNLSARKNKTRVVLNTGKIRINMKQGQETKKIDMSPGELVEFDNSNAYFIKKAVNSDNYSSWKENKLIFDNTSFSEIAEILNHTFGLSVMVEDDGMLEQRINGTVPNDDIEKLLQGLALLLDARVERKEGLVVFTQI